MKPSTATTGSGAESGGGRNQDAAKVPGLPGSKSGPAVKSPFNSPDLEVGGACAQKGGALARHRSGLECSRHVPQHEFGAACEGMSVQPAQSDASRWVSHASGRSLSARSSRP